MVKKRDHPKIEELVERPWCYYCERNFDDARVLLSHQKAKHFRCNHCNRRLNTAGGLSVHLQQVHKETLTSVENAIEGREGVDPEIFGMCGVPEDLVNAHKQRIMNEYFKMEAERRARTGNPPPGTVTGEPNASNALPGYYCKNKGHQPSYIPFTYVNDGICDYELCCDGSDEWAGVDGVRCEDRCKEMGREWVRACVD